MRKSAFILAALFSAIVVMAFNTMVFGGERAMPPSAGQGVSATQTSDVSAQNGAIVLGIGDMLMVRIAIEPKLTGEYSIDDQGKFYFPIIDEGLDFGAFEAAGKTIDQLTNMIKQRVSEYYADGDITVQLVSLGIRPGQSVSVFGHVGVPGSFRYFEGMRMLDLMLKLGSFGDGADLKNIALYRIGQPVQYIDVRGIVDGKDLSNNIEMRPGDYLIVSKPEPEMKMKITAYGSVNIPGTTYVPEGTQLLDLIARVGGPAQKAALGKTYVIRIVDGKPIVIHADLKALIDRVDLKENVVLKNNDIVYVPASSKFNIGQIVTALIQWSMIEDVFNLDDNNN